ncbi:inner membrane transporter RhtA [Orbus hercynius]|uniref:Inner membrane transporter RhtA n=1 Tax=Orbus hercynius TaxID=593135 RepID=A0A495RAS3_9GAMM|nr:EamA family transporter [Orbus hercynius]RKS84509.1 inner membrane transporter RhtA [Orbus hercynius]
MLKRFWPIVIILISMASVQGSSSLAKHLFPILGPAGMTAWRLVFSSIMLVLIFKPWRKAVSKQAWKYIILYGLALGCMNFCFYAAISRIPIGIAVAIELTGPIMVAMCAARKLIDFIWLAIAITGLIMLLPIHQANADLDFVGIFLALGAGACWAMYIVFGRKAGQLHGSSSVAIGSVMVSIVIFPIGLWQSGDVMFSLDVLPLALLVALLASAIPYALDMIALPKVPALTFSTLMSLSPVLGALSGLMFLGETLSGYQWFSIMLIILSSIGTVLSIAHKPKIKSIGEKT